MSHVTPAALAYVFTQVSVSPPSGSYRSKSGIQTSQVRFALSSTSIFSRTDRETDSKTFYTSVLELLEDPEEQDEVKPLMLWWNQ